MTIASPERPETDGPLSFLRTIRQSILAREVGSLWVAEGVVLVTSLLQAAIVARVLGPRDFGASALVLSSTSLVFTFLDPQSKEAVVKYLGAHHANGRIKQALAVAKVAYAADLIVGLAGFALVAGGASWAADHVIHSSATAHLLVIYAAASTMSAPSATSRAVLTTFRRFSTVAVLQAGASLLRTVLITLLVLADLGVRGVIYGAGITLVLESMCAAALAHRTLRAEVGGRWWQGRRAALGDQFREMVRFMVYTDLTSLVAVFVKQADLVVLGYVRGPTEAGYYRVARLVTAPLSSIVTPLQQVVYPRVAAMAGIHDHPGLRRAARTYTLKLGMPIAVAALLGIPLLPLLLPVVAGAEYRPAVGGAMVLLAGGALILPLFWARPILLAEGHVRFLLANASLVAALSLAGYFVLGELMGNVGIALSRSVFAGALGSLAGVVYFFHARGRLGDRGSGHVIPPPTLD
jgi:O-antigen/teichoic acid export membrane protein